MTLSQELSQCDRRPVLGCIADDVTGATDLATNLVQGGMCVVQLLQVPTAAELLALDADAVVVGLKTRSIPKSDAVQMSLQVLDAFLEAGIARVFFKYCSTFDSTTEGNIGPVAEALLERLWNESLGEVGADPLVVDQTIFCPAFPKNGRTVYQGHLFVNEHLLNESGMENHPLNPMVDANLVRFLRTQTTAGVGLLPAQMIDGGEENNDAATDGMREHLRQLRKDGFPLVVTDACHDHHLARVAEAVGDFRLLTGGSGIGRYLPEAYRRRGILRSPKYQVDLPAAVGRTLILAGSCSAATRGQIELAKSHFPTWELDVTALLQDSHRVLSEVFDWVDTISSDEPILIYSSADPTRVSELQSTYGADRVAVSIEEFFGTAAEALLHRLGIRRFIVAGGETSGAVVRQLKIRALKICADICTGVPWTETVEEPRLALALKSGNFGDTDFFLHAANMLTQTTE